MDKKNKKLQFSKLFRIIYSEIVIKQIQNTSEEGEYNPHLVKKKYKDPNLQVLKNQDLSIKKYWKEK